MVTLAVSSGPACAPNHSSILLHIMIQVIPSTVARGIQKEPTFQCLTLALDRAG